MKSLFTQIGVVAIAGLAVAVAASEDLIGSFTAGFAMGLSVWVADIIDRRG